MQARRQQIFRRMKMTEKDKQKIKSNCVLIYLHVCSSGYCRLLSERRGSRSSIIFF